LFPRPILNQTKSIQDQIAAKEKGKINCMTVKTTAAMLYAGSYAQVNHELLDCEWGV
jgi:hypothetical protein